MIAQKRGKNVAVVGAVLQVAFTVVMLAIWLLTDSSAAMTVTWLLAGGVALWLMVALLFYTRQLERLEALELEEIDEEGRIFASEDESQMRPAAARLAVVERWVVPIFTLLWAGYHVALAVAVWRVLAAGGVAEPAYTERGTLFAILIGFLAFLFSRYATGMGTRPEWRPLRAAGSYLLVCVLMIAAVAAALLAARQGYPRIDLIIAFITPAIQVVLAAELVVNFVLDLYRPRLPGQEQRLSFDSRLLGLLAEPQRVGHSLAEAVNYQFGFEVSKTWFYQLLTRSFVPLVILGVLALFAISSVVIVHDGEVHVVSRFGRVSSDPGTFLRPGIRFKWPWPIETSRRFDVGKIHELQLGTGAEREAVTVKSGPMAGRELMLWTEEHGRRAELDFLLAVPPETWKEQADGKKSVAAVSIIKLVALVQYRITDPYKFGYKYTDAGRLLENVAHQEMVLYCSSATLDTPIPGDAKDRPEAIMTYGRGRAAEKLKQCIEKAVGPGGLDLGVEIVYVGFTSVHPPAEAAKDFEKVIEARLRQRATRYKALAEATRTLSEVAGDPTGALKLALAIQKQVELGALHALKPGSEGLRVQLGKYVQDARGNVRTLAEEVEQERLQGKIREDELTSAQVLLKDYQAYLAYLLELQEACARAGRDASALKKVGEGLTARVARAREQAGRLFDSAGGKPVTMVAEATGQRWQKELSQRARAESFERKMLLYRASPEMYLVDLWLGMWDQVLAGKQKHVLGLDPNRIEHWMDWKGETDVMGGVYAPTEEGESGQ